MEVFEPIHRLINGCIVLCGLGKRSASTGLLVRGDVVTGPYTFPDYILWNIFAMLNAISFIHFMKKGFDYTSSHTL